MTDGAKMFFDLTIPKYCWGCGHDYLTHWNPSDLSTAENEVTDFKEVDVCPDCWSDVCEN